MSAFSIGRIPVTVAGSHKHVKFSMLACCTIRVEISELKIISGALHHCLTYKRPLSVIQSQRKEDQIIHSALEVLLGLPHRSNKKCCYPIRRVVESIEQIWSELNTFKGGEVRIQEIHNRILKQNVELFNDIQNWDRFELLTLRYAIRCEATTNVSKPQFLWDWHDRLASWDGFKSIIFGEGNELDSIDVPSLDIVWNNNNLSVTFAGPYLPDCLIEQTTQKMQNIYNGYSLSECIEKHVV